MAWENKLRGHSIQKIEAFLKKKRRRTVISLTEEHLVRAARENCIGGKKT